MKYLRQLAVVLLTLSMALVGLAKIGTEFQMQLGNASNASADPANHSHYLIQRAQYALDYSDALGIPNWVSWDLTLTDRGGADRSSNFYVDKSLPAGFTQIGTSYDYNLNGFDRGHMCPSADRTDTVENNKALFLMSNILPQTPDNNQGLWEKFETFCRSWAGGGYELLITSGPSGYTNGKVIVDNVAVPDFVWKIAVIVPPGTGTALERISSATRVIAIKVPNIQGIRSLPWTNYITSVAQIEADTGFRFFSALPDTLANELRAKVDTGDTTTPPQIVVPPTITQDLSSQNVFVGYNVTMKVTASSGNGTLSYRWFKNSVEIPLTNTNTLILNSVSLADAGIYQVIVTNEAGSASSATAQLTVKVPVITNGSVVWNFNTGTAPSSAAIDGLTVSNLAQRNNNGTTPEVTTTSPSTGAGSSGTYNMGAAARIGALNMASGGSAYFEVSLTAGSAQHVTLSAINFFSRSTGTGPKTLAIYSSADGYTTPLTSFAVLANSSWKLLTPSITGISFVDGGSLTLRIFGYDGTGGANANVANWRIDDLTLSVRILSTTPAITTQPVDVGGSAGGVAGFSVAATGPGTLSYQWRKDGQPILGNASAATNSLALSSLGAADIGSYDCVVSNQWASQTSAAAQLTVTQSYAAWAASFPLPAGRDAESADADGDGVPNVIEYALGLNPLLPDSQKLPGCELFEGDAAFRFQQRKLSEGFAYVVETSTDLATWQQLGAALESSTVDSNTLVALVPSDAPRRFFRLVLGGARTVPVGYTRVSATSGATTYFSPVLDDVQSPLAGIRSGTVDTLAAATVGNLAGAWTGNLADPAAPWALRFTSGAAAGRQFDVKSNTATTLTLVSVDLTTLGIVPGVDRFELVPVETLGTLFGSGTLQGGTSSATADIVQLRSGATWIAYYYDTAFGHWRRTTGLTATNCDNIMVRPGTGLSIQRRGATLPLVLTGRVLATPFRTTVAKAGGTVISLGYPADTTLAALALQSLVPGWRTGTADQVFLHNGSIWVGYYHNGSAWVRTSDLAASNTLPLAGTTSLLIQRSGTTAGTVDLVRNLSF